MSPATPRGTDDEPGWLWDELARVYRESQHWPVWKKSQAEERARAIRAVRAITRKPKTEWEEGDL